MKPELKKLLVLNLPYLLFVYLFAKSMRTMFPARSLMNAFPECPGDMRTSKRS